MFVIDKNLAQMLEDDLYGTLDILQDALHIIYTRYDIINDDSINKYNMDNKDSEDFPYKFDISLTTIRNYIDKFRFTIESKENCLIRKYNLTEVQEMEQKLNQLENNYNKNKYHNLSTKQRISLDFADKSEQYDASDMKLKSLRCNEEVLFRFEQLCYDMKRFDKSYLFSYVMDIGLLALDYDSSKVKLEIREKADRRRKK